MAKKKWSAAVMRRSDAMDLEQGVFTLRSARAIAQSLKRSAEASQRRKAGPFQSAAARASARRADGCWRMPRASCARRSTGRRSEAESRIQSVAGENPGSQVETANWCRAPGRPIA